MNEAYRAWFGRGLAGWITLPILFLIVLLALAAQMAGNDELVQGLAAACDLVGVCLVAADLWNVYGKHKVDTPWKRLTNYFSDFPLRQRPRNAVVNVETGRLTLTGQGVRMRVGIAPGATLEQKVDFLMRRFGETEEALHNLNQNLDAAARRLSGDIEAVCAELQGHQSQTTARLREIEIGDLFLAPLGLLYVAVGAGLSMISSFF